MNESRSSKELLIVHTGPWNEDRFSVCRGTTAVEDDILADFVHREDAELFVAAKKDVPTAIIGRDHPEGSCERCYGPNITWFAPSELWNKVAGDQYGILCPICFADVAEAKGIQPTAWQLAPENLPAHETFDDASEKPK